MHVCSSHPHDQPESATRRPPGQRSRHSDHPHPNITAHDTHTFDPLAHSFIYKTLAHYADCRSSSPFALSRLSSLLACHLSQCLPSPSKGGLFVPMGRCCVVFVRCVQAYIALLLILHVLLVYRYCFTMCFEDVEWTIASSSSYKL